MKKETVYKVGFFATIGAILLYAFNGTFRSAVNNGAKKVKDTVADKFGNQS